MNSLFENSAREQMLLEMDFRCSAQPVELLIVSPAEEIGRVVSSAGLRETGYEQVRSGAGALQRLHGATFKSVMIDKQLPDLDSEELARLIAASYPELSILGFHSSGPGIKVRLLRESHPEARALMDRLLCASTSAAAPQCSQPQLLPLELPAGTAGAGAAVRGGAGELLPNMIGNSAPMALVGRLVRLVAPRSSTVLVTGDTGTGKERIARSIHELSPRQRNPFVVVNCGAIPEALFESELFGYERGAFTGAQQSRMGKIQAARGGTLFLDEVGELPLIMQAKLLRFLQEREVQRLGAHETAKVDVRVIAATNADLGAMVAAGTFRKDLYYRLQVFPIAIPPLRQRREDIPVLAQYFLGKLCREAGLPAKHLAPQSLAALGTHDWPGNVRELEHMIERAFIFAESENQVHCSIAGADCWQDHPGTAANDSASQWRIPPGQSRRIDDGQLVEPALPRAAHLGH